MGLNINGTINVFKNVNIRGGYEITTCNTTISNRDKDGNYTNASMDVQFVGEAKDFEENLSPNTMYTMEIEGFLGFREWETEEGHRRIAFVLKVTSAEVTEEKLVGLRKQAQDALTGKKPAKTGAKPTTQKKPPLKTTKK